MTNTEFAAKMNGYKGAVKTQGMLSYIKTTKRRCYSAQERVGPFKESGTQPKICFGVFAPFYLRQLFLCLLPLIYLKGL